MNFQEYQDGVERTNLMPGNLYYHALALAAEAGEVAGKISKIMRDDDGSITAESIAYELGDVLYHLTAIAHIACYSLEEIARLNNGKLADRAVRGVLKGSGDNR